MQRIDLPRSSTKKVRRQGERERRCKESNRSGAKKEEQDAGRRSDAHQLPAVQPVQPEGLERGLLLEYREHERLHDLGRAERSSAGCSGESLSHQRGTLRRHLSAEEGLPTARRIESKEHYHRTLRRRGLPGEAEGLRFTDRPDLPHGEQEGTGLLDPRLHR